MSNHPIKSINLPKHGRASKSRSSPHHFDTSLYNRALRVKVDPNSEAEYLGFLDDLLQKDPSISRYEPKPQKVKIIRHVKTTIPESLIRDRRRQFQAEEDRRRAYINKNQRAGFESRIAPLRTWEDAKKILIELGDLPADIPEQKLPVSRPIIRLPTPPPTYEFPFSDQEVLPYDFEEHYVFPFKGVHLSSIYDLEKYKFPYHDVDHLEVELQLDHHIVGYLPEIELDFCIAEPLSIKLFERDEDLCVRVHGLEKVDRSECMEFGCIGVPYQTGLEVSSLETKIDQDILSIICYRWISGVVTSLSIVYLALVNSLIRNEKWWSGRMNVLHDVIVFDPGGWSSMYVSDAC